MATVLNRTTKVLLTSVNTPDFDVVDWIINPNLAAVAGVPVIYWKIAGDNVSEMSQPEKDAVDAADLPAYKQEVIAAIDAETERRIALGFEYPASSGNLFSLSKNAQINILGVKTFYTDFTYPYSIRTIDDVEVYNLVDEADALAFVGAAFVTKETWIGTGRAVKANVVDAVDATAVDAAAATYLAGG